MSGKLLLLLLVFLEMTKTLAASRATRVVPSHAAGVKKPSFFRHVSITTLVLFVAIMKRDYRKGRCKKMYWSELDSMSKRENKL